MTSNRMMTKEEYDKKCKALMEENRRANAGKPKKPAAKPTLHVPKMIKKRPSSEYPVIVIPHLETQILPRRFSQIL